MKNICLQLKEVNAETSEGVEVIEFIMEQLQSTPLGSDATPSAQITEEGLMEMMQDDTPQVYYWNPARY